MPKWFLSFNIVSKFSLVVVIPFLFEYFTFYLYTIGEPAFFIFSGARLWVFLSTLIGIGLMLGRLWESHFGNAFYYFPFFLAVAISVLILLLYQICDPRQCYYSGPDGLGWLRLGILFFVTTSVGYIFGNISKTKGMGGYFRNEQIYVNNHNNVLHNSSLDAGRAIFFAITTSLFIGYYPIGLLFGILIYPPLGLIILAYSAIVPFLLTGIICRAFSTKRVYAVLSCSISSIMLGVLFVGLGSGGILLIAVIISISMLASLGGYYLCKKYSLISFELKGHGFRYRLYFFIISLFFLAAVHPFLDAPMNLSPLPRDNLDNILLSHPSYYAGVFHNTPYFSTKRVEVEIDLRHFDVGQLQNKNNAYILAGIGAQSPNCCKDGLDYGYRSDVLLTRDKSYFVAQAWATCDQNIACSGLPWQSTMHKELVQLPSPISNITSISLSMEWDIDTKTSNWFYRINNNGTWTRYSSFTASEIENPYYNIGILWVGPLSNPISGSSYFYQAGVSMPWDIVPTSNMSFRCPSYYDSNGTRHCSTALEQIVHGESHWKVLWKWGLQSDNSMVVVDNQQSLVKIIRR